METSTFQVNSGQPEPFGISRIGDSLNFSIVAPHANTLALCLFSLQDVSKPLHEITIDPKYRTGEVWHFSIRHLPPGLLYCYRINGSMQNVLDPYAKEVFTTQVWGTTIKPSPRPYIPLGVVDPPAPFDWSDDKRPAIPIEDLIIYEMHVRGFTQHSSSGVSKPGTYLGIIEKIPHLLDLGINAVELMPIHEFNECDCTHLNPKTKTELCNYWGYSTVNFFSPMQRYATRTELGLAISEFKTLVKELHRQGIEVILDVVYNHTGEGNSKGPIQSFKGIDSAIYYMLDEHGNYLNYSGCGNTFNCNHPVSERLILDSLRYWVIEMHVDGFRFDLASILTRDLDGSPLESGSIVTAIARDPLLANVKLIAEPWDAAGLYQVSCFPEGQRFSEWNGRYRDKVRAFIKGTGRKTEFVTNLCGSQDMYYQNTPCRGVNFITAHDGFTLADLVTYSHKHNTENGENNRDGADNNESWNCGVEGPTNDKKILSLRERQMRNLLVALMVSRGLPMVLMGDEYAHTRLGNNNPWCQDNELNWFLWTQLQANANFYQFFKKLIKFRKAHPSLRKNSFFTPSDIEWHGANLAQPQWEKADHLIAFAFDDLYFAFNLSNSTVNVEIPAHQDRLKWHWVINTANVAPDDIREENNLMVVQEPQVVMQPRSVIVLHLTSPRT